MSASTKFVKQVWGDFLRQKGHDATCMPQLQILSATPGRVRASLQIEPYNVNRLHSLHGGLIGSLVDTMGSLALSSRGLWLTGVSTDIHTTFVRGAGKPGDSIIAEASIDNMGRTLAFTSTRILHPETGKLLAHGIHTKYIADALKDPQGRNLSFSDDGEQVNSGMLRDE